MMANELNSLAGQVSKISNSMRAFGLDSVPLQMAAGAIQLIGGTGQAVKGLIAAKEALTSFRLAEGSAQLVKYGLGALAVGALAVAGGVLMGEMIERAINTTDGGGLRRVSEAYA